MTITGSVPGHSYRIQHSPDLAPNSWQDFGDPHQGTGADLQIVVPLTPTGGKNFYRIVIARVAP